MSDQDLSIFKQTANDEQTLTDQTKALIGEGKKYKDLDAALGSIAPSQAHIAKLETEAEAVQVEMAELREAAAKAATMDDVLNKITPQGTPEPQTQVGLNAEDVATLVTRQFEAKTAEDLYNTNAGTVATALQTSYGTEAEVKYSEKAAELGMSVQELNKLAGSSPKAVLAMFNTKKATVDQTNQSNINTANLNQSQSQTKEFKRAMTNTQDAIGLMAEIKKSIEAQL